MCVHCTCTADQFQVTGIGDIQAFSAIIRTPTTFNVGTGAGNNFTTLQQCLALLFQ